MLSKMQASHPVVNNIRVLVYNMLNLKCLVLFVNLCRQNKVCDNANNEEEEEQYAQIDEAVVFPYIVLTENRGMVGL